MYLLSHNDIFFKDMFPTCLYALSSVSGYNKSTYLLHVTEGCLIGMTLWITTTEAPCHNRDIARLNIHLYTEATEAISD